MNAASQQLSRPLGYQAEMWLETPAFFPSGMDFHLDINYAPYQLKNINGSSGTTGSVTANVNTVGVFGGLQATAAKGPWRISPFVAVELGGVYDTLTFTNIAGVSTGDSGLAFALRAVPGLDIPIYSKLGVVIETPITIAFFQNVLTTWAGQFSLRWKL